MSEPSKEAMEKAREVIGDWNSGEESTEDQFPKNPDGPYFAHLERRLALEFTNYQKRIEELEKDLKEAHMLLTGCQGTVLFKSVSFAKRVENFISKSHLAKGVKEG
jgi:hypothetical protein